MVQLCLPHEQLNCRQWSVGVMKALYKGFKEGGGVCLCISISLLLRRLYRFCVDAHYPSRKERRVSGTSNGNFAWNTSWKRRASRGLLHVPIYPHSNQWTNSFDRSNGCADSTEELATETPFLGDSGIVFHRESFVWMCHTRCLQRIYFDRKYRRRTVR